MDDRGQVTVFLSLLMLVMLALGLTTFEIVRIHTADAKLAEAASGAAGDLKAAYHRELFEDYHLLAIDKEFGGQGEGKLEKLAADYLEYTLENDGSAGMSPDSMEIKEVALDDYRSLLDNKCLVMRQQISDYMGVYEAASAADSLIDMVKDETEAGDSSRDAVSSGKEETSDEESSWSGDDPRDVLDDIMSGGILNLVAADGDIPSDECFLTDGLPSAEYSDESDSAGQTDAGGVSSDSSDDAEQWEYEGFDELDDFEEQLAESDTDALSGLSDDYLGIRYALEFFSSYTNSMDDRSVRCEVEYMIAGKDNDCDNLQGVVNRLVAHRLPVNLACLVTDKSRVAQVEAIAVTLALVPGITYSAAKYLLLGCWAYAETLADIRVLLSGGSVQFIKSSDNWLTDIENLGELSDAEAESYEGADAVDYEDYLAILLAEHARRMYYRMADLIQLALSSDDDTFRMENMIYRFELDIEASQSKLFAAFIESVKGVDDIDGDIYTHSVHIASEL